MLTRAPSACPMLDRDVKHLAVLGIVIEISLTRLPIYTLRGGVPSFAAADLRALAIIRDTFGERHPQVASIQTFLETLPAGLSRE
jgi:hypothetical protein